MIIRSNLFTLFLVCCVIAVNAYIYAKESQELEDRSSTINSSGTANYASETLEQERWRDLIWPADDSCNPSGEHDTCPYEPDDSREVIVLFTLGECDHISCNKT